MIKVTKKINVEIPTEVEIKATVSVKDIADFITDNWLELLFLAVVLN